METFQRRLSCFFLGVVVLFTLIGVQPAYAIGTTRYVATTGADSSDCSNSSSPCLTIVYAYTQAVSGDTISLAAGTYTESSEINMNPGSSTTITITGAGTGNTFWQAAASAGAATHRHFKVATSSMTLNVQNLTLRYGVEASGGAVNVANGVLNLTNVVISDNQVTNLSGTGLNGGAISLNGGTTTITNSAIINNSVTTNDTTSNVRGSGGGLFIGSGTVTLNNVTVSGNSSIRGGGGLFANGGTMNVNYSTIANNISNNADGTAYSSLDGGGINRNNGVINLKSSIVAGNKKGVSSASDNDCNGTISSQGYNLTGSSTGCSLSGTGDVTVTASTVFTSLLGSLADNGGSTYTHALIVGGAAVDVIPNGTNSCGTSPFDYDQRGGVRPYNSSCDIGAYELKTVESVSTTGTDSGDCTVTDCASILYAYSKAQAGNTINVAAGTYTETSEFDITKTITINGAGATSTFVQAAASAGIATHRFYKVIGSTVTANIQNLTLRYGVQASGGALNIASGTMNLTNVVLSDNQVNNSVSTGLNGGAISINGGTVNITNSAIINNSVTTSDTSSNVRGSGGGIFIGSGSVTLNNVTVSGNSSIRGGGGLFANGGTMNINYSTIANNTSNNADGTAYSSLDGGGINRNAGTINLKSSIVAGNKKGVSSASDNDCNGTITSQGYNLTGTSTGCSLSGTGDVSVTASTVFTSVLGSLANNGGSTYTHLLYGGNSAQDAIPNGTNNCGSGTFATDQLGNTRPYNTNCDMGAYESQDAKPTVSMSSTATDPTNISPISVTVTFSESVTGFTSGDITAGNATVDNFSGSGASYSFDLIPSGDGTVTADIAAGVAQDSVYNYNTAATQFSLSYDGTGPTVTGFAATTPTNSLNIPITASSFTATDTVGVTGYLITTTSSTPSVNDSGWSASAPSTYSVGGDGTYTLYPWAKDAVGNISTVYGSPVSVTVDTTAPTVLSITRFSASNPTSGGSVDFFLVFSEGSLSGVDATDFTLTTTGTISGASISSISGSGGPSRTVTVNTGSGDGTIRLDLADDDSITDAAGNKLGGTGTGNGSYTSGQTFTIDKTAPTVSSSVRVSTSPTNASSVDFTVSFSESVSGVDTSDFDLTLSGVTGASVTGVTGSGTTRTVSVNTGSGDGSIRLDVLNDNSITDGAANTLSGAFTSGESYTVDKTAPTVSSSVRVSTDPTNASSVDFTVTFSESVTGVDTSDFDLTLSGVTGATVTGVTGSGTTRTVSVSTSSGDGTIRLDVLDDDSITDGAANTLSGAFTSGESYTIDKTAPSITINNPDTTPAMSKTITASASSGTLTMSNTTGSVCDGTLTFVSYTSQTFNSAADNGKKVCYKAEDTVGNIAYSLSSAIGGIDSTAPTVSSIVRVTASPSAKASVQFLVTFSESVTDITTADFSLTKTVTGGSITSVTGSGTTRTVTVNTGSGNGILRLDVPNTASITDLVGNALTGLPFTSGQVYTINKTLTYTSNGSQDGWILESTETSNTGGTLNSAIATFLLGDAAADKQYRSILSFNTASLPDNATITGVTIKIKRPATGFLVGNNNPFTWGLGLKVDVCKNFFGTTNALQVSDFNFNNAANCKLLAATFGSTPTANWYSASVLSTAFAKVNKVGLTQFRLFFVKDDNDDGLADYLNFYSGNATATNRPQLVITYSVP